ncbi:hypothetical protein HYPBUDRAFT_163700 [Hyphopichia burtonii NRRL Y-1933]|uniref:GATA-type domain-containing protein n=1 Tax=Hyphopichia burtonii NRRL Y-1933 TaxID=984485 RepID=A0A1E4RCG1_9ASCO|nr:hypothetical protein HYPBUDRAFT_163700 [Hyphopichia burtonii NRRL Y-1933]ODV64926.1 hypothetical protein HYPBUDRAFT_163700 [Hyphopichia burtonii NRRL Y-1933]
MADSNPTHPNAKTTTHVNNGTTTTKTNITSPVCRNCKTQNTPLWRRDETGQVLCNACGLFFKLHGRPRPISLKTDTIKSRNRIKQPNPSKNSGSNTPEFKVKDSKSNTSSSGKKSPKSSKKKSSNTSTPNTTVDGHNPNLTPLLPAAYNVKVADKATYSNHLGPLHSNHLPNHLHHQVQPLHYPSSTPTQFAPGLQRITSPLLLSTTSSLSNARSSSNLSDKKNNATSTTDASAAQAAGALETMSNELGPSATFKPTNSKNDSNSTNGISLMNNSSTTIKKEPTSSMIFSTPSTALQANSSNHPPPPKLPALGSGNNSAHSINSPSFGPQFHLNRDTRSTSPPAINHNLSNSNSPSQHKTSLPPIHQAVTNVNPNNQLPHFQNSFSNLSNNGALNPQQSYSNESNQNNEDKNSTFNNSSNMNSSNSSSGNNNNNNNNNNHEVTLLKTRISELELVNDLYRTRIMELEAMEQAARLREQSMRKRLDEVIKLQESDSKVIYEQQQQLQQLNQQDQQSTSQSSNSQKREHIDDGSISNKKLKTDS